VPNMSGVKEMQKKQTIVLNKQPGRGVLGFCKESIPARACMAHRLSVWVETRRQLLTKINLEEESGYEFARRYR